MSWGIYMVADELQFMASHAKETVRKIDREQKYWGRFYVEEVFTYPGKPISLLPKHRILMTCLH